MKNLIEISQTPIEIIEKCIQKALFFRKNKSYPSYPGYTVANLFYENSTRTRISFEMAARRLSIPSINLDLNSSSEKKGEIIEDTILTLSAMGISHFVIRHPQNGLPNQLAKKFEHLDHIHIINAGDGTNAHPSQALLDMVTIINHKPKLESLKIALIGNIQHSRVANSFQCLAKIIGVKQLILVTPPIWEPHHIHFGEISNNLNEGIADADVIICLRIQSERLQNNEECDIELYKQQFTLTKEHLKLAKPDVMILHPGPINRGIEITDEVADGPHSFILEQVKNGVFTRMAILETLIQESYKH